MITDMLANKKLCIMWILFLFAMTGCVIQQPVKDPFTDSEKKESAQKHLKLGKMYEEKGSLFESLEHYGYAFKADSQNSMAVEGIIRLTDKFVFVGKYYQKGMEFYNNEQYKAARHEFETALEFWPHHSGAKIRLNQIVNLSWSDRYDFYKLHFQKAMVLFRQQDYLMAKKELEISRKYKKDCLECQRSEEKYKDVSYKQGIGYFENEELTEAVKNWKPVHFIDPNYEEVNKYIERAMKFLKGYKHD